MSLVLIIVSIAVALLLALVRGNRWRLLILLGVSAVAVYSFQPTLPIRGLDFWLPTITLVITILTWLVTAPLEKRSWKLNWSAYGILVGIVLLLGLTRYFGINLFLTASRPPAILQICAAIVASVLVAYILKRFIKFQKGVLTFVFLLIVFIFILLKVPFLTSLISAALRRLNGQSIILASALDLRWLGFSYIAFRLLHTIRDRQTGRLPDVSLAEYVVYVIFFPALAAGPIDRIEHFVGNLRQPQPLSADDLGQAGKRILIGLFKKFVLADTLAIIALNPTNAFQVRSAGWAWVLLYAYSFQIYLDFSGYTDLAIGMGRLIGIQLPENFNAPYLKPNLAQFWNNWHMTLTQWFRTYFFNPVTRALRTTRRQLPVPIIILVSQVSTMLLIGLWHGVTLNYVVWGLWHGIGLFIHNRWSEMTRPRLSNSFISSHGIVMAGSIILTFHFVTLGWVFFALPNLASSFHFFQILFGFG
jgi:alginate O-acetyltransferase complex protein AlgI